MNDDVEACLVGEDATLRDAMIALDRGARRIALAVDPGGVLVGILTDGDIRRALLGGAGLDDPLAPVLSRQFVRVDVREERVAALELMQARAIGAVPVVDGAGRPVGLHLLNEFLEPVARDTPAVVMAGGRGMRLRPLTESLPKPMLRVAGRPILERIVLHLVGHGITRIYLAVGYLAEVIEAHFGDGSQHGARIEYLREERPLGTAGALGLLPTPPTGPLLVMNGDLVTQVDLGALIDAHTASGAVATVGMRRYVHTVPFGCVERAGDHVTALVEKPAIVREVNSGIYVLGPTLVHRVERDVPVNTPDILADAIDRGEFVGAFEIEDDWLDVGHREQLAKAREGEA
jgi:dTDP-glucose pyrophosphorylase